MLVDYNFQPKDEIKKIVIFLHGYGADGADLISLAELYAKNLPNTAFYSPTAPDSTTMGMGYQWFSDNNWTFEDKPGIQKAKDIIEDYIQNIITKHNLKFEDVAIVSFSQGTMTSLYALPRFKNKLAGLVAFSGKMMWHEELNNTEFNKFPVLFYHGSNDDIVDPKNSIIAEKQLEELGFNDTELEIEPGLEHGISLQGVQKSSKFLKRVLFK